MQTTLTRRSFLTAMTATAAAGLAGCAQLGQNVPIIDVDANGNPINRTPQANVDASYGSWASMYAAVEDNGFQLPAIPIQKMDKRYLRRSFRIQLAKCRHNRRGYGKPFPLSGAGQWTGNALRRRHRPRRLCMVGPRSHPVQARMATLDATG